MSGRRYDPRHQYQLVPTDPHGNVNCSAYTLAMAMDAATHGGMVVTGELVRALSNEPNPDPASPGLRISQLVAVSKKLHVPIIDNTGASFDDMLTNIRHGHRYVGLQGDADQLPAANRCQPFGGGHMVLVVDVTTTIARIKNPLCHATTSIALTALRRYADKLANDTGVPGNGIRYFVTRSTPDLAA